MGECQPIETAPKDETRILLYTPAGIYIGHWCDEMSLSDHWDAFAYAGWWAEGGETRAGTNMGDEEDAEQQCPPTHWMPLPKAPE